MEPHTHIWMSWSGGAVPSARPVCVLRVIKSAQNRTSHQEYLLCVSMLSHPKPRFLLRLSVFNCVHVGGGKKKSIS